MTERTFLSLGSNIEPERNLPQAIHLLATLGRIVRVSAVYQNPAVGPTLQPDFLNAAVLLETDLTAEALRVELRALEQKLGRHRGPDKFAPRTIDIDIVLFGSHVIQEAGMTIPDPGLMIHAHLAVPVAELDPQTIHPVSGESLGAIAERLRSRATLNLRPDATLGMRIAAGLGDGGSGG